MSFFNNLDLNACKMPRSRFECLAWVCARHAGDAYRAFGEYISDVRCCRISSGLMSKQRKIMIRTWIFARWGGLLQRGMIMGRFD